MIDVTSGIPSLADEVAWRARRLVDPRTRPLRTPGLFVLGMHRSGTSCLTGLLERAGLASGGTSRPHAHNRRGMFEQADVRRANSDILRQFGGSWTAPPARVPYAEVDPRAIRRALEPFRREPRWVVKDPRMVLTLEAWLPHVRSFELVGTFRHPAAVARSLQVRNEIPLDDGQAIWTHYNRRLVSLHRRFGFPLIHFGCEADDYLASVRILFERLSLRFEPAVSSFYERDLVNQSAAGDGSLPEAETLYAYLRMHRLRPDGLT